MKRFTLFNILSLIVGFAFLYVPIAVLVVYSFNEGRSVGVWTGWSTRWYGELLHDEEMLEAAWVTLRVAFLAATAATVLGTLAAIVLTRYGRFLGRSLFSAMVYAPVVMPEVILGLSFLLFYVAVDFDRGFWTITLSHITFCMCFVTVVVQSRLAGFDRSLEEAAMDLGSRPFGTFMRITMPLILPAVVSGWMLAFTLSIDDVVISNFTSGPGASTLPIRIYSSVRLGVKPEINAICTVMIGIVTLGVVVASLISRHQAAVRERETRQAATRP